MEEVSYEALVLQTRSVSFEEVSYETLVLETLRENFGTSPRAKRGARFAVLTCDFWRKSGAK